MIEPAGFAHCHGFTQQIGREEDVRIGKEQVIACRSRCRHVHRVAFAQPTLCQSVQMDDIEFRILGGETIQ